LPRLSTGTARRGERNAEQRRRAIVDAAREEFSAHGYDGARMDAIVARAGVAKNLAYHYFTSKEGLFIAVMEETYVTMRSSHSDALLKTLEPRAAIERLVRSVHRVFIDHPEIIPLLNSENLHRARHIAKSQKIRTLYNPLHEALVDILERGSRSGAFRPGVDPVDLYITISGLSYFYLSNSWTLGLIFHEDLLEAERLKKREDHIVEVVLGYLGALPLMERGAAPAGPQENG